MIRTNATRIEGWEARFEAFIDSRREQPFRWGINDCCMFAADAVFELIGIDLAREYRGSYDNAQGAARTLAILGGLAAGVGDVLGKPMPHMYCAQRGDVVLIDAFGRDGLGICTGMKIAGPGTHGVVFVPFTQARAAWRV